MLIWCRLQLLELVTVSVFSELSAASMLCSDRLRQSIQPQADLDHRRDDVRRGQYGRAEALLRAGGITAVFNKIYTIHVDLLRKITSATPTGSPQFSAQHLVALAQRVAVPASAAHVFDMDSLLRVYGRDKAWFGHARSSPGARCCARGTSP